MVVADAVVAYTADGTAAEEVTPYPVKTQGSTVSGARKADSIEKVACAVTFELDNPESKNEARESARENKHPSQVAVDTQATRWKATLYLRRLMQGAIDNWHWHLKEIDVPNRDLEAQGSIDMSVDTTRVDRDHTQQALSRREQWDNEYKKLCERKGEKIWRYQHMEPDKFEELIRKMHCQSGTALQKIIWFFENKGYPIELLEQIRSKIEGGDQEDFPSTRRYKASL